jgi:hypothetical protein
MFHGNISAATLADQLAARFNDRQRRVRVTNMGITALVQIGSKHGTPVSLHITDTTGGVLVTMSRDRDWLDKLGDASEMIERAASKPVSLIAMIPDALGELSQENIAPQIWDAINDLCALTRALAGERDGPQNPKICEYCGVTNNPDLEICVMCGAPLPSILPRKCPKCSRSHASDALFCQACGTRLIEG